MTLEPLTLDAAERLATALRAFLALLEAAPTSPCPACNQPMPADYHYCDSCGARLPGGAA